MGETKFTIERKEKYDLFLLSAAGCHRCDVEKENDDARDKLYGNREDVYIYIEFFLNKQNKTFSISKEKERIILFANP